MQLLPTLPEADTASLDALNRRLWAWVEGEYHHEPPPRPRRRRPRSTAGRWPPTTSASSGPECDLDELFLFEEKRKVQKDRTVSLHGVVYEVDASLVGETVTLRFDPSRRGRPVDVYFKGRKIEQAKTRRRLRQLLRPPRPRHQGAPARPAGSTTRPPACRCATSSREGGLTCTASTSASTHHPFGNEIEPEDLFPAAAAKELEVRLAHLLEMRGIGLVTGDSGSGKTCGARRVLAQLHSSLYRVLYVSLSTGNVMDLYKTISWEMGLPVERIPRRPLPADPNSRSPASSPRPAAGPSSSSTRRTTSAPTSSRICASSPTTRWTPRTGSACSCSDRPSCGAGSPWPCTRPSPSASSSATTCPRSTRDELPAYLAHRLRLAGTELPLFEPAAHEALFQATGGLPRKINLLAHHALLAAALARARTVSADHVQAALPEVA